MSEKTYKFVKIEKIYNIELENETLIFTQSNLDCNEIDALLSNTINMLYNECSLDDEVIESIKVLDNISDQLLLLSVSLFENSHIFSKFYTGFLASILIPSVFSRQEYYEKHIIEYKKFWENIIIFPLFFNVLNDFFLFLIGKNITLTEQLKEKKLSEALKILGKKQKKNPLLSFLKNIGK